MEIEELRVLNYRSVRSQQTVPLSSGAVLVGPNNAGKSNLLRAVDVFFRASDGPNPYDIEIDRPHRSSGRTSLRGVFHFGDNDAALWREYVALHGMLQDPAAIDEGTAAIYLEFSRAGNPSYKLFPTASAPRDRQPEFSRRQQQFVHNVLSSFSVRYVPSAKDWESFFNGFLVPALGEVIEQAIREQLAGVREALAEIGTALGRTLCATLGTEVGVALALAPNLSELLGSVSIEMSDPTPTDIAGKGQGIQSAFLIAAIGWMAERERQEGRIPVWLLEEPEAYTHPALARSMLSLVNAVRSFGPVVFTTHSLGLVPNDVSLVRGVDHTTGGGTVVREYASHAEATRAIRDALGVKAADYFGFGPGVVAVEGPSDLELITWALGHYEADQYPHLRQVVIHDFGGVKHLAGFLVGTLGVLQREVPVVSLFDGDDTGQNEVRGLSRRFSNSDVRWASGLDYLLLPRGRVIEGLFPSEWIRGMDIAHPEWFIERPTFDMTGALVGFRLRDQSKRPAREHLQKQGDANPDQLGEFQKLLETLEDALTRQLSRLTED